MTKNHLLRLLQASLMCCVAVLFTACDELFATEDNPATVFLRIEARPLTINVGETYTRTATSYPSAVIEYTSSDTNIATVNNNGTVTGIAEGEATITATATGYSSNGKKIFVPTSVSYQVIVKEPAITLETPLTMKALTDGTIVVKNPQVGMQYTLNGGTKTAITSTDDVTIDVAVGDKVAFYGDGTNITCYGSLSSTTKISGGTADVKVYGNIMSLVDETGFATATTLTEDYTFSALFSYNSQLIDASGLLLPATTLTYECYSYMFWECNKLTTAPQKLPAMILTDECYSHMFNYCTELTTAPELPATTLADGCYNRMFAECTKLSIAPELPATTLTNQCYMNMFNDCYNLRSVTCLATDISASNCTRSWLLAAGAYVTGEKVIKTPGTTIWPEDSFDGIPPLWTRQNPDGSAYEGLATPLTLEALTAGTIVIKNPKVGMQYSKNGGDKTVITSTSDVTIDVAIGDKVRLYGDGTNITIYSFPTNTQIFYGTADVKVYGNIMSLVDETGFATATTLTGDYALSALFDHNTHLIDASGLLLPATTLSAWCYSNMFNSCTNLTTAPELPATTLKTGCYWYMFYDCSNLNSVTCLATDISAPDCTNEWLSGAGSAVTGTKTFYKAAAMTGWGTDASGTNGWDVQNK